MRRKLAASSGVRCLVLVEDDDDDDDLRRGDSKAAFFLRRLGVLVVLSVVFLGRGDKSADVTAAVALVVLPAVVGEVLLLRGRLRTSLADTSVGS